jgi:hypothetical protein
VIKESSGDALFAMSLENESEEFYKFESVAASALRFAAKCQDFSLNDLVEHVLSEYDAKDRSMVESDMNSLINHLKQINFLS